MGDCAEYMLDCDDLNAESQQYISQYHMKAPEIRKTKHLQEIEHAREYAKHLQKLVERAESDLLRAKTALSAVSKNLDKNIAIAIEKGWMKK